jgi:F-type H+-transporting ATPase subunit delta
MIRDRVVAHRYAGALFGAAVKLNNAEEVLTDLQSLHELYLHDTALQRFLEAPDLLTEDKVSLVERVLRGRVSELTVRFLLLLLEKKRVQHLPLVLEHYRDLLEEHLGLIRAQVQTAVALPEDLAVQLKARLEKLTHKKIALELKIEPAIIGGMIVRLGGKVIDASLRHQLNGLREQLASARVRA